MDYLCLPPLMMIVCYSKQQEREEIWAWDHRKMWIIRIFFIHRFEHCSAMFRWSRQNILTNNRHLATKLFGVCFKICQKSDGYLSPQSEEVCKIYVIVKTLKLAYTYRSECFINNCIIHISKNNVIMLIIHVHCVHLLQHKYSHSIR